MITNRRASVSLLAVFIFTLVLGSMMYDLATEPSPGWIQIVDVPNDARIAVDDCTPLKPDILGRVFVQLGRGVHRVVMTRPGYQPVETTLVLEDGDCPIVMLPKAAPKPLPG